MVAWTLNGLRPVRLLSNLRALKLNQTQAPFKNYCSAQSKRPILEEKPTQCDAGSAIKLLFQLVANNVSSTAYEGFQKALPNIIKDILELPEYRSEPEVKKRLEQIILYNTPSHTQLCGIQVMAVSEFYEGLRNHAFEDKNHLHKTCTLAWCTELNVAAFLMKDDIMDGSTIRHGRPSWHTTVYSNTPGFVALNDAMLLEQAAVALFERTFEHHPAQQKLSHAFRQAQAFCISSCVMENILNLKFTTAGELPSMNDYCRMRKLQNGYIGFILPFTSVAILNGCTDPVHLNQLKTICMDFGLYFAIQRDYLDSFPNVKHAETDTTDLQNARITWLLITAFERASPSQWKQIQDNIGKSAASNVNAVRDVFQELKIPKLHAEWQERFYEETTTKIKNLPETLPRKFLQNQMEIFRHKKIDS